MGIWHQLRSVAGRVCAGRNNLNFSSYSGQSRAFSGFVFAAAVAKYGANVRSTGAQSCVRNLGRFAVSSAGNGSIRSLTGGLQVYQTAQRNYSSTHFPTEKRNILDHKRRLLAAKYELRRKLYKALCKSPDLPSELRDKHRDKLSKLPRNSSFTRVRNRCILSGRPRAVYEKFRMSRIVFRDLASRGALMGVKKASW